VTPDGFILSLLGPFEAKINDHLMFRISNMPKRFNKVQGPESPLFLYGDIAYEGCYQVITPFQETRPLSAEQHKFNDWVAIDRISVEQAFGRVQRLWHTNALDADLRPRLQPVAMWYAISILLTNVVSCLRGNKVGIQYNIEPMSLEDYLEPEGYEFGMFLSFYFHLNR
jgi:hypothetical protein